VKIFGSSSKNAIDLTPARIILLGYTTIIFLGTILLSLPMARQGPGSADFIEALFTATSAVCVTGLIVVDTATYWTLFGQITILILIQIGGLGFMTLSTLSFMIIGKRITFSERVLIKEDLGHLNYSGLVRLVRYVLILTLSLEAIGTLLLFLNFRPIMDNFKAFWYALFHAVSAFNNAGFDIFGNSLEGFTTDIGVNITIMSLIIFGGLGFTVIAEFFKKSRKVQRKFSLHTKLVVFMTVFLLFLGFLTVLGLEYNNPDTLGGLDWLGRVTGSFFLSVTSRTAGFNTVPTGNLQNGTLFFAIILMFIGASPCSTGGGVKTTTMGVFYNYVITSIRGDEEVSFFSRRLSYKTVNQAVAIISLSGLLVVITTLILSTIEPFSFIEVLFESVSAFATVGLSTGITSELSFNSRIMLIITMLAGRIGPLTFFVSLGDLKPKSKNIRYPKDDLMIG